MVAPPSRNMKVSGEPITRVMRSGVGTGGSLAGSDRNQAAPCHVLRIERAGKLAFGALETIGRGGGKTVEEFVPVAGHGEAGGKAGHGGG